MLRKSSGSLALSDLLENTPWSLSTKFNTTRQNKRRRTSVLSAFPSLNWFQELVVVVVVVVVVVARV